MKVEEKNTVANRKFRQRFAYIEKRLREQNRKFENVLIGDLEELWQEAKKTEAAVTNAEGVR